MNAKQDPVEASYDRIAAAYTAHIAGELEHKPLDRELLDRLITRVQDLGTICDMGCGPGHVAGYLRRQGAAVCGIDLSEGMLAQARQLHPDIAFRQSSMLALEVADAVWGGIAAFYSLIHIPRSDMNTALLELKRALKPGGWLLAAFHIGDEDVHRDEMWGEKVTLDFLFFQPDEIRRRIAEAGFTVHEVIEREPYEGVEHPSRRAYLFAQKPISPAL